MKNTVLLLLACVASWLLLYTGQPEARPAAKDIYRLWTQAELLDCAARHASRVDSKRRKYIRYIALNAIPPVKRYKALQVLGYVTNSLSRCSDISLPQFVPGTEMALAWFDFGLLNIDARTLDSLGEKGSGPSPFPEPYFHAVTVSYKETLGKQETYQVRERERNKDGIGYLVKDGYGNWVPSYVTVTRTRTVNTRKVRVLKSALGGHLGRAQAIGLAATLDSDQPIFDYRWFVANALVEPRYHELLGLGDTEDDVKKLAAVDIKLVEKTGNMVRGAVLQSEVAHHNRVLRRFPTVRRYGRGTYQESFDYKTSIDLQDVVKDLLLEKPDAKEIIFTLPNGTLGFFVVDGNGKRLDKADGDIAANRRSKFRDTQVRTAYHCMACHLPDKGWIEVDDEVRELAKKPITLLADAFSKKKDKRGEQIRQQYLSIDYNELLRQDQSVVEAAVKASTRGLTPAETIRFVVDVIYDYNERPVPLAQLALEMGYPSESVTGVIRTAGLDHPYTTMLAGRKARRDQVERAFAAGAFLLYKKYGK